MLATRVTLNNMFIPPIYLQQKKVVLKSILRNCRVFLFLIWSLIKIWSSLCSWGWSKTVPLQMCGMTDVCHHTWFVTNQGIKHRVKCARQALCQLNHTPNPCNSSEETIKGFKTEVPVKSIEPCVCGWWFYVDLPTWTTLIQLRGGSAILSPCS